MEKFFFNVSVWLHLLVRLSALKDAATKMARASTNPYYLNTMGYEEDAQRSAVLAGAQKIIAAGLTGLDLVGRDFALTENTRTRRGPIGSVEKEKSCGIKITIPIYHWRQRNDEAGGDLWTAGDEPLEFFVPNDRVVLVYSTGEITFYCEGCHSAILPLGQSLEPELEAALVT